MFFTGWNNPVFQRSEQPRTHFRRPRALAGAVSGLALILAGCGGPTETADIEEGPVTPQNEARVTLAFAESQLSDDVLFLPNSQSPWQGLVVSSLQNGGLEVFNVDGQLQAQTSGSRYLSVSAAPQFALRGATIPLIFGVDSEGALRANAFIAQTSETIELALSSAQLTEGISAVCHLETGIGYEDLVVLTADDRLQIWRISDIGEEVLQAELQSEATLPFPARQCDAREGEIIITGPASGIALMTAEGQVLADAPNLAVRDLGFSRLLGREVVLVSLAGQSELMVLDATTLEPISSVALTEALSTPAVGEPDALASTNENYGGMGFGNGIVAIYDRLDNRIKLISRDTLARAVIGAEVEFETPAD